MHEDLAITAWCWAKLEAVGLGFRVSPNWGYHLGVPIIRIIVFWAYLGELPFRVWSWGFIRRGIRSLEVACSCLINVPKSDPRLETLIAAG